MHSSHCTEFLIDHDGDASIAVYGALNASDVPTYTVEKTHDAAKRDNVRHHRETVLITQRHYNYCMFGLPYS